MDLSENLEQRGIGKKKVRCTQSDHLESDNIVVEKAWFFFESQLLLLANLCSRRAGKVRVVKEEPFQVQVRVHRVLNQRQPTTKTNFFLVVRAMEVQRGPELNHTRPETDEKLYRLITLHNGLECLLVSDVAFGEEDENDGSVKSSSGSSSESSEASEESEASDDEDDGNKEEERQKGGRRRRAAVAMTVGVGSFHDPEECQGLAHFLEHLIFMGSEKYPTENELDAFLSKNGGDSNAFTECENTTFYINTKVKSLGKALDIFANMFVAAKLLEEPVDRELHAIESEFQLSKNSDANRLQEIMCRTSKAGHPLGKFSWGNLFTLKEKPQNQGVNSLELLRELYDKQYLAENMKLCVCAPLSLDKLEEIVNKTCSEIRSRPSKTDDGFKFEPFSIAAHGFPFQGPTPRIVETAAKEGVEKVSTALIVAEKVCLQSVFHVVPIRVTHAMMIIFQIPSQMKLYKTKLTDYLAHLIGHESEGSILHELKSRGWATSLSANGSGIGFITNSACSLFQVQIQLSRSGICKWKEVVGLILEYIGMLKSVGPQRWVFDELAQTSAIYYRFLDETDPEDLVQDLSVQLLPMTGIERQDLLHSQFLMQEWDPEGIRQLLDLFTVENMRVDLLSSYFGRDKDYFEGSNADRSDEDNDAEDKSDEQDANSAICPSDFPENPKLSGEIPSVEPYYGTRFWARLVTNETSQQWNDALKTGSAEEYARHFHLPRKNPYIARDVSLKAFPSSNALHELVGAYISVKPSHRGKAIYGFVERFNADTLEISTTLGGKYSVLKLSEEDATNWDVMKINFTVKCSGKDVNCNIIAGGQNKFSGQHFSGVAERFLMEGPPKGSITPPLLDVYNPSEASCSDDLCHVFWLHNRVFRVPKVDMFVHVICGEGNKSSRTPFSQVASSLFITILSDALNDEAYMASMADLHYTIEKTQRGLQVRVCGSSEKALELLRIVLEHVFLKHEAMADLDSLRKKFALRKESLTRGLRNSGLRSAAYANALRLQCLREREFDSSKLLAEIESDRLENLEDVIDFARKEILGEVFIDGFLCGDVVEADAEAFHQLVSSTVQGNGFSKTLPRSAFPTFSVFRPQPGSHTVVRRKGRNETDANNSLEMYFQIGPDNLHDRVLVDLIDELMEEPIYDKLRTKEQLGYSVHCSMRMTDEILGFVVRVTSNTHSIELIKAHVFSFLSEFATFLVELDEEEFEDAKESLIEMKLDEDNNLSEESKRHVRVILDHSFDWHACRREAFELIKITKKEVIQAYRRWLLPTQKDTVRIISACVDGVAFSPNTAAHGPASPIAENLVPQEFYIGPEEDIKHFVQTQQS